MVVESRNDGDGDAFVSWREFLTGSPASSLALVCLAVWLHAADSLIVATMMPSIVADIGGTEFVGWTVSLYEIGSIVAGAASAVLTMRHGLRAPMAIAAAVFAAGCGLAALAPDMATVLAGRALQGLGGGGLVAMSFVAVGLLFPRRYAARAMAAVSMLWGVSAFLGPLIGGVFVEFASWRAGFWFFAAQAVGLAVWIAARPDPHGTSRDAAEGGVPLARLGLLCVAVILVAAGGVGIEPLRTSALIAGGLACLGLFLVWDARTGRERLLPRRPFDLRRPIGGALLMILCFSVATIAITAYGPLLVTAIHGVSALTAGYLVACSSIGWTVAEAGMSALDILTGLAAARREGRPYGVPSICSAHPVVIRAATRRAAREGRPVLIEATCNQVNQLGGYTGMTPAGFVRFVSDIARDEGLDAARIVFGGDHLGPNPWRKEPMEEAFSKADAMVDAYVRAGFSKIHLDASMGCAGEPPALDDEATARRAARLAKITERAAREAPLPLPLYIIGTEVPVPGGADHAIADLQPTSASAARETFEVHRAVFEQEGLGGVLERVIALVVQPGVEFGNENVVPFRPERAAPLTELLDAEPGLVFEAHSTDYQSRAALRELVRRGFPILKVGPGLTFALREALYGLDLLASELVDGYGERPLRNAMEELMLAEPADWQGHYHGSDTERRVQRHYSYSDRIRYYWGRPQAEAAVKRLMDAMAGVAVPETLMGQFLPRMPVELGRSGDPMAILVAAVDQVIADYEAACQGG